LNLNEKLDDSRINTDQISLEEGPRVPSPSKSVLKSTPVSSPTLVEEIKTLSSSRSHTSRVFSRRHELTPYPRSVDLESDQELSLTPTESENVEVSDRFDLNILRRLDFDAQVDEDKEIEFSSQLLEEFCKISDDEGDSKKSSSVSQDMFSPDTNGNAEDNVADDCENVPASANPAIESENEESSPEDDNDTLDAHLVELSRHPVESSNGNESKKFAVMIPESSSESSLAELSPLDTGLVGQSQGDIENEDVLAGMFSENEEIGVNDESDQEEDLLAVI